MSYSHNQRKKNIKRFKKDPTTNPKFTKRDGQWKVVLETLDIPKQNGNKYGIEILALDITKDGSNVYGMASK